MANWYVIQSKPHHEARAKINLERQGWVVYLPMIRQMRHRRGHWQQITEPLFPRYLFVRLNLGHDNISSLRYTLGVQKLVSFSDQPAVVPDHIVDALQLAEHQNHLATTTESLFKPGQKVVIAEGPLSALEALFLADKGEQRVTILLSLLGGEQQVTLHRDLLRPA